MGDRLGCAGKLTAYEARINQCWKKYERRNRELAHLASNLLILLALVYDCRLICGENLTTLKTEGRGRGVRGRFRNWRNNTTVRGELWRVLKYKCHLLGIRARQVEPRGTTHTCPRCHHPAKTYLSPASSDRKKALDWAPWLCCSNPACLWNGARDYAASLNIARLGLAFLLTYHETRRYQGYRMTDSSVKPASYSGAGATLLLPPQGIKPRPFEGKHIFYAGWSFSTSLRTSHPNKLLAVLSTSQLRKDLLRSA
jgi:putative transposase